MLRANKLGPTSSKLSWARNRNPFPLVRNDHFVRKGSNFRKGKGYFSSVFVRRPFRAKGSPKFENRNFTSVLTFDVHFVRKGCAWHLKIAILHQFLTFDVHFVQKGFDWHLKIAILRQFLTFDVHFVRKGCDWHLKIAIFSWFSNGFSARNKAIFDTQNLQI